MDFVTQSFTLTAGKGNSPLVAISFRRRNPVVVSSLTPSQDLVRPSGNETLVVVASSCHSSARVYSAALFSFVCCCEFIFHFFPFCLVFCCPDPCVVVLYVIAFRLIRLFWLEELVYFVFPSFFWSFHDSACFRSSAECWTPSSCIRFPPFSLGVMQVSSLVSMSSFFVFQSSKRCWLTSFFFSFSCASPDVFDPIFLFNFCCVDLFITIVHEGDVAVLDVICV